MRALRIWLIVAVVLGGLFVAADRIAVNVVESKVADRIKSSQGLNATPDVSITGFPFLTQALGKEFDEVDVRLGGVTATADGHSVNVTEVKAKLHDVKVNSGYSSATVVRADGSARISYADLAKAAPKGATVSYAGAERAAKGQIQVGGQLTDLLDGAGVQVPPSLRLLLAGRTVSTYSTVTIEGGSTVRVRSEGLPKLPVPGFDEKLRKAVDYDLQIAGMPRGIKLDKVEASKDGLLFTGTGTNVSLAG
ncbi:LmeA family phospholipid-binding protein [Streptomyces sp. BR1]|uniref:LmeA family phospholipid-binding protein n=1 Tax=Streptomyces sp. BR1 TaxID=1592323 RepID=UPI00402B52ED